MNKLRKNQVVRKERDWVIKSDNYFDKRRQVMDIIYKARRIYTNAPRVEVKIMNKDGGLGWFNHTAIAIGEDVASEVLVHVVLHELCHTWFKLEHDEKCPLMKPHYNGTELAEKAWARFEELVKENA
jgi:ribulose-5-phosphate 4-epimerase/fuculose-1-phosphate aldolase